MYLGLCRSYVRYILRHIYYWLANGVFDGLLCIEEWELEIVFKFYGLGDWVIYDTEDSDF